jgi:hypothetical protein
MRSGLQHVRSYATAVAHVLHYGALQAVQGAHRGGIGCVSA